MKKFAIAGILLALSLTIHLPAFAQLTNGNLAGTVKDATGAVIANATVVAVNEDTKVSYTGTTSSTGVVGIQNLPAGTYDVTASAAGFKAFTYKGLVISSSKTDSETFTLPPAGSGTTVEVSADAAIALDTTSTNLTQSFEAHDLAVLPSAAVGLGVLNVSLLSPNVASSGGIGIGTGPSIDGNRPRNNNFTVEGIDNNDKGVTGPLVDVPNDAVGEFSLIVGQFSPEFGHSSGGQFNTNIKSGSNSFHGVGYEYFQNRNLNALSLPAGQTAPKARYDDNRYGGQIGGPIKKDKLFFFANYQYHTNGQSEQYYLCTPTAAGLAAIQAEPGQSATNVAQFLKYTPASPTQVNVNTDVACGVQATGNQFINIYPTAAANAPTPGYAGLGNVYAAGTPTQVALGNYLVSAPVFTNNKELITSGDYTISPKDSFRLRYVYNGTAAQDTAAYLPVFFQPLPFKYHLVALSEYHTFTPNLTNEARLGFNRYATAYPAGPYAFPGLDMFPGLQFYDLNGLTLGPDGNAPQSTIQNMYQFTDNILYTYKTHTFKIGFDGRKFIAPQTFTQRVRGDYEWDYLTEYLLDEAPTDFGERSTGNFIYYGDQTALYGYANDTWRAMPNLTINYGLRYEFTSVPVGERAQSLNTAASVPGLVTFSAPKPQYTNFEPRIGISYSIDEKTQIRAGFSMANDVLFDNLGLLSFPPQYSSTNDVGTGSAPAAGSPNFLKNGGLPTGTGTLATFSTLALQRSHTSAYLPNQVLPYSETWTLGVQRVIASNYTAEIRYTGNRGIHLATQDQINVQPRVTAANQLFTTVAFTNGASAGLAPQIPVAVPGVAGQNNLAAITALSNIVPAWSAAGFTGKITSYQPFSQSNYNALSGSLIRRLNNGLSINAAYTWSKTMDDATAEVFATVLTPRRQQNSQCISCDYSRSALDRNQRFSLAVVYDLPYFKHSNFLLKNIAGNWEIAPIYVYETPEYATVLSGVTSVQNGDSATIDRTIINPNGVKGTGSAVVPVYSVALSGACAAGTATAVTSVPPPVGSATNTPPTIYTASKCNAALVGYQATNPNAYYIQAGAGTLPNSPRNSLPIRPIDNVDVTLVKRISFTERYKFEFQAQAFNVLNHPQYLPGSLDNVNTNNTASVSPAFQEVGQTKFFNQPQLTFSSNARAMQLVGKFIF